MDAPVTLNDAKQVAFDSCSPTTYLKSGSIDHHADIVTSFHGLNTKELDSFELESVKIELINGDGEEHLIDPMEYENKYQDIWKMSPKEEVEIEPPKCTSIDSSSDTNTDKEIQIVKNKPKRTPTIVKNVKPKTVRNDKLPCVICNEVFLNRTVLNRHTESTHNVIQCIRCPFTTTTRFVICHKCLRVP